MEKQMTHSPEDVAMAKNFAQIAETIEATVRGAKGEFTQKHLQDIALETIIIPMRENERRSIEIFDREMKRKEVRIARLEEILARALISDKKDSAFELKWLSNEKIWNSGLDGYEKLQEARQLVKGIK